MTIDPQTDDDVPEWITAFVTSSDVHSSAVPMTSSSMPHSRSFADTN